MKPELFYRVPADLSMCGKDNCVECDAYHICGSVPEYKDLPLNYGYADGKLCWCRMDVDQLFRGVHPAFTLEPQTVGSLYVDDEPGDYMANTKLFETIQVMWDLSDVYFRNKKQRIDYYMFEDYKDSLPDNIFEELKRLIDWLLDEAMPVAILYYNGGKDCEENG
jgi:hypothetical protein